MKPSERITLATAGAATLATAAWVIARIIRVRADRLCRAAAGESRFERTHGKIRRAIYT